MPYKQHLILKKDRLNDFISKLSRERKVAAPVARGFKNFAFEEVTSAKDIQLTYIPTILPPKKYFMPPYENILEYDINEGQKMEAVVEYDKMVLFGVHTCDLAGIQCLNMVLSERPRDINYLIRKDKISIIGYECNFYCDEFASCALVNNHLPKGGYDLFFTDLGDCFIVHVNTQEGEEMVAETQVFEEATAAHFAQLEKIRQEKRKIFKNEIPIETQNLQPLFAAGFESAAWQDLDSRCLACGNCTAVCPTCYCFDVFDEINLDYKTGRRYRRWDSCQNETFAKVAGGESFRKQRGQRQRHRYYRKFKYLPDIYSRFFCTGCGRCTRTCMAKIVLKETLTQMIKEHPEYEKAGS